MYTELQLVAWIMLISIIKSEIRIEVTESTCGGDFNLDDVGSLDLDYYGAFLGKGQVIDRLITRNKKCVFNIHSTNYTGRQICISASVKGYYNSFACGIYFRYYLGSRNDSKIYTCEDMSWSPLCTELGSVVAEIVYHDAVINNSTFLQLHIYSRPYQETLTVSTVDWRAELASKANEKIWGKYKGDGKSFLKKRWWVFLILGVAFLLGGAFGIYKAFAQRHIQAVQRDRQIQQMLQNIPLSQVTSVPGDQQQPMLSTTIDEERGSYR